MARLASIAWIPILLVAAASACAGEAAPSGLDEPLRIAGASFKSGELADFTRAQDADGPAVTAVSAAPVARPRQAGIGVTGRTSGDAYSVALRLADLGTGWWVVPVGAEDLTAPGELGWQAVLDLGAAAPSGQQTLEVVAIDGDGVAGPVASTGLCIVQGVDTTRNACDPKILPPAAAISLSWDTDADVDLVLVTPSGVTVDRRNVVTLRPDGGGPFDRTAPGVGVLQVDSNPGCAIDSIRRETVTFQTSPEPGTYLVYANLFQSCGERAVNFTLETYVRTRGAEPDTYGFELLEEPIYGVLLGAGENGGANNGLFVTAIEFP